jgi:hypothetical protein
MCIYLKIILPSFSYSASIGTFRLSFIQGDVQIKTENTTQWVSAVLNMPLMEGDRVRVHEAAKLEIQLKDGSFLRLDENSLLLIQGADSTSYQFYLGQGHAYVNFSGADRILEVDTPVSLVRAHDESRFRIDLSDYGSGELSVFEGEVYAENRNETVKVYSQESLVLSEDRFADKSRLGRTDDWERWNNERDRIYEGRTESARYLPDELKTYSSDFDEHGKWVYVGDYGYVWTPTVIKYKRWSPYRYGRWRWVGHDYVWIGYEPWGWAPYHYGRWSFRISLGWFWVPPVRSAVYWGPGYVGWVYTPTYVAWIPLAPRDIYYGYGYYGPRSVNIYKTRIHNKYVRNVYKNVYVDNSVTIIYRDSFVRGKYQKYRTKKNPFLKKKIYVERTRIKHKRQSFDTVTKKIRRPYKSRQEIRDVRIRDLKKNRTIVKERPIIKQRRVSKQNDRFVRSDDGRKNKRLETPRNKSERTRKFVRTDRDRYEARKKYRDKTQPTLKTRTRKQDNVRYRQEPRYKREQKQSVVKLQKRQYISSDNRAEIQIKERSFNEKSWSQSRTKQTRGRNSINMARQYNKWIKR